MRFLLVKKTESVQADIQHTKSITMAKPIEETPVLYGQDADKFLNSIESNENKVFTEEKVARMIKNYRRITFVS